MKTYKVTVKGDPEPCTVRATDPFDAWCRVIGLALDQDTRIWSTGKVDNHISGEYYGQVKEIKNG